MSGRSLFEQARERLIGEALKLKPGDQALAIIAGLETETPAGPPSGNLEAVVRALRESTCTLGVADLGAAVEQAKQALAPIAGFNRRLIIASDFLANSVAGIQPLGPGSPPVTLIDLWPAEPELNRGLAGALVAAAPEEGSAAFRVSVQARVQGAETSAATVGLEIDGVEVNRLTLAASGAEMSGALLHHFGQAGLQTAWLTLPPDSLNADNRRPLALIVPPELRVLLINGAPSWIQHKDELFYLEKVVHPGRGAPLGLVVRQILADRFAPADLDGVKVVLLANVRAPGPEKLIALRRFVEEGGGLLASAGDQADPDVYDQLFQDFLPGRPRGVHLTPANEPPVTFSRALLEHAVFRVFAGVAAEGLYSTTYHRYWYLEPGRAGDQVLLYFSDGSPALIEGRRGKGTVISFAGTFDRDWGDWPARSSFLPVVQRLLQYLGHGLADWQISSVPVGAKLSLPPLGSGEQWKIIYPGGQTMITNVAPGSRYALPFEATSQPGPLLVWRRDQIGQEVFEQEASATVVMDPWETLSPPVPAEDVRFRFSGGAAEISAQVAVARGNGEPESSGEHWFLLLALAAAILESVFGGLGRYGQWFGRAARIFHTRGSHSPSGVLDKRQTP